MALMSVIAAMDMKTVMGIMAVTAVTDILPILISLDYLKGLEP